MYTLTIAETLTDLEALSEPWAHLERSMSTRAAFQSYGLVIEMARLLESQGNDCFHVITVFDGKDLIAVLPLRRVTFGFLTLLTGFAEPFQQYSEILLTGDCDHKRVRQLLLDHFSSLKGIDCLVLEKVRADSLLEACLDGALPRRGEAQDAPCLDLRDWQNFDTYYKTVKSKTRKNLRNARNRLDRDGALNHQVISGGDALEALITRTFGGRLDWLDRSGLTSRAFSDDRFADFVGRFSSGQLGTLDVLGFSMTLDDVPIAEQWGFVHNGIYYAFISAMNSDYAEYSPGRLHLGDVIRSCYEHDVGEVELMIPSLPYKMSWASSVVKVHDYIMPLTPLGQFYYKIWLNSLRPRLKSILQSLPPGPRRLIMSLRRPDNRKT